MEIPKYQIHNVILLGSEFVAATPKNGVIPPFDKLKIGVQVRAEFEKTKIFVEVVVNVNDDKKEDPDLFSARVSMVGIFERPSEEPHEHDQYYANVNAAAVIYPFIREHIAMNTMKSGMATPFMLPPMNFIKMYNDKRSQESTQVKKKPPTKK